ncbi:hypothetical protein H8356DRAFT_1363156 [Neocallimastix lanati (nom. inval.)]|nr:hypothetical protein H8356DRAFT_1363156 [Neocallimastix sp. JGI-2020a]
MLDVSKIKKELPYLEELKGLTLYDITESKKVFAWVLASVEDEVRDVIKSLVSKKNNEDKEVKVYLDVTGNKWAIIRNMKITEGETIKNFNTIIEDHIIILIGITKNLLVVLSRDDDLQEAYMIAELAEKTEKDIYKEIHNKDL